MLTYHDSYSSISGVYLNQWMLSYSFMTRSIEFMQKQHLFPSINPQRELLHENKGS